jgi:hypothetical protein
MSLLTPKQEDYSFLLQVNGLYHMVSELFPSLLLVRVRESFLHSQDSVKQEHSLFGPFSEITVERSRHFELDIRVVIQCFVNISQTWRASNGSGNRE